MIRKLSILSAILLVLALAGCGEGTETTEAAAAPEAAPAATRPAKAEQVGLDVYKSPTCGCCGNWIEHMQHENFAMTTHHPADLAAEKQKLGVAPRFQSCHTAVSEDGYVFEGHVPAKLVQRFLKEKPAGAIGLAVPGMPEGSPGMEAGDRFSPYQVLLLKEDGTSELYASIDSAPEQY